MKRAGALALAGAVLCVPVRALARPRATLTWYATTVDRRREVAADADTALPAASIIKLLIALAAIERARAGELTLRTSVELHAADRVGGSDRFGAAPAGPYPFHDLLAAMLSLSDNTAANALLRFTGMERCNAVAVARGLRRTRVRRRFYDWAAQRRGLENTTSARESA